GELKGVVNLNDASADELVRLPGIGPAKAEAIVEHRRTHPFRRVEENTKGKGIGRKTVARLRPDISLTGATTLEGGPPVHRQFPTGIGQRCQNHFLAVAPSFTKLARRAGSLR